MKEFLSAELKTQIKEVFADLRNHVEILFFGSEEENCDYCAPTLQLLEEVNALSELISIRVYDFKANSDIAAQFHVDKAPGFVLAGKDNKSLIDYGIRFAGIPAGLEFSSFINSLLLVSKRDSGLSEKTRQFLKELKQPVHLQVYVTQT